MELDEASLICISIPLKAHNHISYVLKLTLPTSLLFVQAFVVKENVGLKEGIVRLIYFYLKSETPCPLPLSTKLLDSGTKTF